MTNKTSGKSVIYVDYYNPCCNNDFKSHEELLKEKAKIATLYLVDSDKIDKVWGDDWNDSPSCCNSGLPYTHSDYPEITKIDIFLGGKLEIG